MSTPTTVFRYKRHHPLNALFEPASIAVIGATEEVGSAGRTLLWNLISTPFGGTVFPIHPTHSHVLGIQAYPTLAVLPQQVELAVITTPAPTVPGVIAECVAAGVKGALILSTGFRENGEVGVQMEQQIVEQARRGKLRIIGPNSLGIMSPPTGLNAIIASAMAHTGQIGFISQSGALCTAVIDWSLREQVGFSAIVSIGSMVDVNWGDLIEYLGSDPQTSSIVLYLETLGNARSFLSAAREIARSKPIILLKAGRTMASARDTSALVNSQEVFEAACRRSGILLVERLDELFSMAEVLATQPRPQGSRLTIVTNARGPGILATDALLSAGGTLSALSPQTHAALDQLLPTSWSHGNPIDVLGDADPERYARALALATQDPQSDGFLVILAPQATTNPTVTAEQVKQYAALTGKPILASWMGGANVARGKEILLQSGIPTFAYPDTAARVFASLWRSLSNVRSLYETPLPLLETNQHGPDRELVATIIATARQAGRTLLTESETKHLLTAYGIPVLETQMATSEQEAVARADIMGYPVELKPWPATLTHKNEAGGLSNADAVRRAYQSMARAVRDHVGAEHFLGVTVQPMVPQDSYELLLGSSIDPQFGQVLLFGAGGQWADVSEDRVLALPPLTTTLARRMVEQTRVFQTLAGACGRPPVDLDFLEQVLVRVSYLVAEQRWIKAMEINPLLASPDRLVVLDARIVLHGPEMSEETLPRLAIRPYPLHYAQPWTLPAGTPVMLRPIRPDDEPLMVQFHHTLSDESVYFRWLHMLGLSQRIAHERLIDICFLDYDREMALVVDYTNPVTNQHEIMGVGRIIKDQSTNEAEFAMLVADQYQHQGLGSELLRRLIQFSRDEHIQRLTGDILADNQGMQAVCKKLGFHLWYSQADQLMKAELVL